MVNLLFSTQLNYYSVVGGQFKKPLEGSKTEGITTGLAQQGLRIYASVRKKVSPDGKSWLQEIMVNKEMNKHVEITNDNWLYKTIIIIMTNLGNLKNKMELKY